MNERSPHDNTSPFVQAIRRRRFLVVPPISSSPVASRAHVDGSGVVMDARGSGVHVRNAKHVARKRRGGGTTPNASIEIAHPGHVHRSIGLRVRGTRVDGQAGRAGRDALTTKPVRRSDGDPDGRPRAIDPGVWLAPMWSSTFADASALIGPTGSADHTLILMVPVLENGPPPMDE